MESKTLWAPEFPRDAAGNFVGVDPSHVKKAWDAAYEATETTAGMRERFEDTLRALHARDARIFKEAAYVDSRAMGSKESEREWEIRSAYNVNVVEPNTGRTLFYRHAGGGRTGLFGANGEFLLEVTSDFLDGLRETAKAADLIRHNCPLTESECLSMPIGRSSIANLPKYVTSGEPLPQSRIGALSRTHLREAARIRGIAVSQESTDATLRQALYNHADRITEHQAKALNDHQKRSLEARVRELESCESAEVKKLKSEWRDASNSAKSLAEELRDKSVALQDAHDLSRRLQRDLTSAVKHSYDVERENRKLASEAHDRAKRLATLESYDAAINSAHNIELSNANSEIARLEAELSKLTTLAIAQEEVETAMEETNEKQIAEVQNTGPRDLALQVTKMVALQRVSKIGATGFTKVLENAGVNPELLRDPKVQRVLEMIAPLVISQFGDKIPGIKNVQSLQPIAYNQVCLGLANVLDDSLGDLMSIVGEAAKALNEATDETVEQLPRG